MIAIFPNPAIAYTQYNVLVEPSEKRKTPFSHYFHLASPPEDEYSYKYKYVYILSDHRLCDMGIFRQSGCNKRRPQYNGKKIKNRVSTALCPRMLS
jgi:hypothetical protein